jgi:hypothetical protein
MLADVTERLASLGYTVTTDDNWVLGFISNKVEVSIKNDCGVYDIDSKTIVIPDALHGVAVDMVCGEFLKGKKSTGTLTGFDLSPVTKSIAEGDTKVEFSQITPEQRLDAMLDYLLNHGKGELVSHRCIRW